MQQLVKQLMSRATKAQKSTYGGLPFYLTVNYSRRFPTLVELKHRLLLKSINCITIYTLSR